MGPYRLELLLTTSMFHWVLKWQHNGLNVALIGVQMAFTGSENSVSASLNTAQKEPNLRVEPAHR